MYVAVVSNIVSEQSVPWSVSSVSLDVRAHGICAVMMRDISCFGKSMGMNRL